MPDDYTNSIAKAQPTTGGCGGCCSTTSQDLVRPAPETQQSGRSFRVAGLDCAEEVRLLTRALAKDLGGAEHLAFDVINARMTVLDTAAALSDKEILARVARTGLSAAPWSTTSAEAEAQAHLKRQKLFTGLSAGFWGLGLAYHVVETGVSGAVQIFAGHGALPMPAFEIGAFLLAVVFGAWLVVPKALMAARQLAPDMNLLMVIAVLGAIALGEFFEAATVSFFFALSLTLESWSVGRARNAVSALLDLAPPTARLVGEAGRERDVPATSVSPGDLFVVRGGDRIPLDGVVASGAGAVDQAPITGESALIAKEAGDEVFAGTINGEGTLTIRATKPAHDTVLAKITRMVGDAHLRRAKVEQWVTRFARIYTPIIMALALVIAVLPPVLLGGLWEVWTYNALVLLVIACPCALVISTPVSIVAALAASARNGVLIKGGAYVEIPSRVRAIALDKTGTLTEGEPEVVAVHALKGTEQEVLRKAAALEARSSHPLARAILARADQVGPAEDVRILPGRGVTGHVNGQMVWLGSARFAAEHKADLPQKIQSQIEAMGGTLVAVGVGQEIWGVIEVRDRIRSDAKDMVAALHALGVEKVVMLTGDTPQTAQAVANAVGIDEVRAELLPHEKLEALEELTSEYDVVAMIGDGVNDAPAMARADFAIAMGAIGSDAAIETADIALMSDDISKVPWLIDHARHTMAIIRQNIGFALLTKVCFVALTALGMATMWGAILADVGVSLAVVANALRLLRA